MQDVLLKYLFCSRLNWNYRSTTSDLGSVHRHKIHFW